MRGSVVLAILLLSSGAFAQTRAGVIVVGPDSAAVGAAQKAIEASVAGSGATVRGARDLAPVIGGPTATTANAWSNDPAARTAFEAALAEAKKSYFSDLMPRATAKLDEAAGILERAIDAPGATRVKVSLWRAAVALRLNQKDAATGELRVALLLVPNLEAEANSPPPMVQLLSEVRAKSPKPFTVTLNGLPANAVVKVDDVVFAPGSIAVLPGPHVLDVISAGFRPFNKSFDATGDLAIDVVLVPSIAPAWEKLFEAIVARGELAENEKTSLESLATREKLDVLVIASVKPAEIRSAVWRRADGRVQTFAAPELAAIASWVPTQLGKTEPVAIITATPKPTPPPGGAKGGARFSAEAGVGYVRWNRTIESEGSGTGYEVPGLSGGGPRLRLHGGTARFVGELQVAYFSFGTMDTNDAVGDPVDVPGGSMLAARLGAGYRHAFGAKDERSPALIASLGGLYESYAAKDLAGSNGVFPSHTRSGADVRLGVTFPAGPVSVLLEAGVVPFSTWTEDPEGATGDEPTPAVDRLVRLGVDMAVGGSGRVALDWSAERRTVTYTGTGGNDLAPEEATRDEFLSVLALSFRYRF